MASSAAKSMAMRRLPGCQTNSSVNVTSGPTSDARVNPTANLAVAFRYRPQLRMRPGGVRRVDRWCAIDASAGGDNDVPFVPHLAAPPMIRGQRQYACNWIDFKCLFLYPALNHLMSKVSNAAPLATTERTQGI